MKFKLQIIKNVMFLKSPFSIKKFKINNDFLKDNFLIFSFFVISNNDCYFESSTGEFYMREQINISIKEIENNVHPFDKTILGPALSKYHSVIQIIAGDIILWLYVNIKKLGKRNELSELKDLKRNCYLQFNNIIYYVVKIEEKLLNSQNHEVLKLKSFRTPKEQKEPSTHIIVYDCETITIKEKLYPFIIYAYYENSLDEHFDWYLTNEISEENLYEGVKLFTNWLLKIIRDLQTFYNTDSRDEPNFVELELFGYNNFNFDNHFIYEELRSELIGFKMDFHSRFGKTTGCLFRKKGFLLKITDLIKWFPATPLSKACKNFQIKQAKYDVDIIKYTNDQKDRRSLLETCEDLQTYFKSPLDADFKKEYLNNYNTYDIYRLIIDYCKRDVDATFELYLKVMTTMEEIISKFNEIEIRVPSKNIFDYISPPQFAFTIFKSLLNKANQKFLSFKDSSYNEFIYNAYMGGRCDFSVIGEVTSHNGPNNEPGEYIYVDVTSEYPTAMTGYFPDVNDIETIDIGLDIDLYRLQFIFDVALRERNLLFNQKKLHETFHYLKEINEFKGFFRCNIFPPDEVLLSTWGPVGIRVHENGTTKLKFLNCKQENRVLCTAHLATLITAGWRIELVEDRHNILFKSQSKIIKDYVTIVGRMKTEAVNNPSLRNLLKLLLNSLYGKLSQKPSHILHDQEVIIGSKMISNDKYFLNDWRSSYHYIGAYVTAYSNQIIFTNTYFCELHLIYNKKPISFRTNICIYTDTDSIIINKYKKSDFATFKVSEDIGEWKDEMHFFDVSWKYESYGTPIKKVIVLSKKSYYLVNDKNELICIKAKGIHGHIAKLFTYENIKKVASGIPKETIFEGLIKKPIILNTDENFDYMQDFIKTIHTSDLKKTLNRETIHELNIIKTSDPLDELINKENLLNLPFNEEFNNYLVFTCSTTKEDDWLLKKQFDERQLENFLTEFTTINDDDEFDERDRFVEFNE